jgi:hypothetical protein
MTFFSQARRTCGTTHFIHPCVQFYMPRASDYHLISKTVQDILNRTIRVVWSMVFNSTFNNILVILWLSVLLVEETRVPGETH